MKPPVDMSFYRRRASVPAAVTLAFTGRAIHASFAPLGCTDERREALVREAIRRQQDRAARIAQGRG